MAYFIPLPIPGSIYGMVLMFVALLTKVIKIEQVKETAEFLVGTMTLMFIPPAVGLIDKWDALSSMIIPALVAIVVVTPIVMAVTGKVADFLIKTMNGGKIDVN